MKKEWFQTNIGIVVLLFLFFPLGLYLLWKHGTWNMSTKWKITGGVFLVLFLWSVIVNLSPMGEKQRKEAERIKNTYNSSVTNPTSTPSQKYTYEIVDKKDSGNVENYKVLIKQGDDGKAIAIEVKKDCKKSCNIDIYDDRKALELQTKYDAMTGTLDTKPEELQTWKQNNYVFVADHLVGYVSFDTGEYQEYPYRDWYYKELTAGN